MAGADVAIFPDPELFITGPIAARLRGIRSVIDVHEEYRLVAKNRTWVPVGGAGVFGRLADVHRRLGTRLAASTLVVSADLARGSDVIVSNRRTQTGCRPARPEPQGASTSAT